MAALEQVADEVEFEVANGKEEPDESRDGTELRELFGKDLSSSMRRLWTIVEEGDYRNKVEEEYLFFEIIQYQAILSRKLYDLRREQYLGKVCRGIIAQPNETNDKTEVLEQVAFPFMEKKKMMADARALFWQVALELSTLISDIVFLVLVLYEDQFDLFVASLFFLLLSFVARVLAGLRLIPLVDWTKKAWWYLLGFLVNMVETNSGLAILKRSLKLTDKDGLNEINNEHQDLLQPLVSKKERDSVSVEARNNYEAGWSELFNIAAVTIVEDIPQLVVELLYLFRIGFEAVDALFYLAIGTTLLHIFFQWIEAVVTLQSVVKVLPSIKVLREWNVSDEGVPFPVPRLGSRSCKSKVVISNVKAIANNSVALRKVNVTDSKNYDEVLGHLRKSRTVIESLALHPNVGGDDDRSLFHVNSKSFRYLRSLTCRASAVDLELIFRNCFYLEDVNFTSCVFGESTIDVMVDNCKSLKQVDMSKTNLTEAQIVMIAESYNLKLLLFMFPNATTEGIRAVGINCVNLIKINFDVGESIEYEIYSILFKNCENLEDVTVGHLDEAVAAAIGDHCKKLELLGIDDSTHSSSAYRNLFKVLTLRKFKVGNSTFMDEDVKALAQLNPGLEVASIESKQVTNDGVLALAESCVNLFALYLTEVEVDDDTVVRFSRMLPKLTHVSLYSTGVGDNGVRSLIKQCNDLQVLNVWDTNVTPSTIEKLDRKHKSLRIYSEYITV